MSLFRAVLAVGGRMPELGADYYNYREGVRAGMLRLAEYLAHQAERGLIDVPDPELASAQFLDMAQTTMARPVLFGAATSPSDERIDYVVDSAVRVFMAAHGSPAAMRLDEGTQVGAATTSSEPTVGRPAAAE